MDKQNKMMDFIWLLNAVDNSTCELKDLCVQFLKRRQEFYELSQDEFFGTERRKYMDQELQRYLKNLSDLHITVEEVTNLLRINGTEVIGQ
ncbi:MAG: hypothetical protein FWG61_03850 [Firmicutes bacterium]|nr:hypothetical protein [Bacillota bacterium]